MDLSVIALVLIFAVCLATNVPIAVCIGIATFVTMMFSMPSLPAVTQVAQKVATGLDSFALLAIPFFILSGQLMGKGGIARRLIDFAKAVVGVLPGGLAYVNILGCMLFGAISGSAVAATSAIGSFMIPEMEREGYDRDFSAAVNITSSTTGLLIPPSNILIVYSLASGGVSVAALFVAGYGPGILTGLLLMLAAAVVALRRGYRGAPPVPLGWALRKFVDAMLGLLLVVIVIGGMVAGVFTATEAAAIAVLYSAFLAIVVYRQVNLRDLMDILIDTVTTSAVVLLLIGTSMALSWLLAYKNIPQGVGTAMLSITTSKVGILLMMNAILLVVGTFMDATPAVLIFTPVFLPMAIQLGLSPVHFGIIMILNLCIGICTPPVGAVLFVGCSVAKTTIAQVVRPLLPLFLMMILSLLLVTYIPQISLFLPRLFGLE